MNIVLIIYIILDLIFTRGITRLFLIGFKYTHFKLFSFMSFGTSVLVSHRVLAVLSLWFILVSWQSVNKPKKLLLWYLGFAALSQTLILDAYFRGGRVIKHTPHLLVIFVMIIVSFLLIKNLASNKD